MQIKDRLCTVFAICNKNRHSDKETVRWKIRYRRGAAIFLERKGKWLANI